jgi:hypothetical protein
MWDSTLLSREDRYLPFVTDGQRRDLNSRQGRRCGLIFRDSGVENAILIVDAEIEKVEGELARVARKTGNGKTK